MLIPHQRIPDGILQKWLQHWTLDFAMDRAVPFLPAGGRSDNLVSKKEIPAQKMNIHRLERRD